MNARHGTRTTAITVTRVALAGTWTAVALVILAATLTGAPDPFTGFVVVPAALLGVAGSALGVDTLLARRARAGRHLTVRRACCPIRRRLQRARPARPLVVERARPVARDARGA